MKQIQITQTKLNLMSIVKLQDSESEPDYNTEIFRILGLEKTFCPITECVRSNREQNCSRKIFLLRPILPP